MNRILHALIPSILLVVAATGQDGPPKPDAEKLARLKVFEGGWEGSGTVAMEPGKTTKWTSQGTSQWVLGGFFLQGDTTIRFEGNLPPLQFHEFTGWDAENHRYVRISVSNEGKADTARVVFPSDDTVLSMWHTVEDGMPVAMREVSKLGKDSMTFTLTRLAGQAEPIAMVTGSMKKVAKATPLALASVAGMGPAEKTMAVIGRMVGEYEVAGELTMMPGMPPMKIHGRDSFVSLFGGSVVQQWTHGDPTGAFPAYESIAYYTWNADDRCYDILSVSNMGEIATVQARLEDSAVIAVVSGVGMGKSTAMRMVTTLDKDGRPTGVVGHACIGNAEPIKNFAATYKMVK